MKRLLCACALLSLLAGCASNDIDRSARLRQDRHVVLLRRQTPRQAHRQWRAFNKNSLTAAHRQLPFGTRVKVTNLNNDKSCMVRINDRWPHTRGRLIDLSHEAAEQLGMLRSGTARVRVQALDD